MGVESAVESEERGENCRVRNAERIVFLAREGQIGPRCGPYENSRIGRGGFSRRSFVGGEYVEAAGSQGSAFGEKNEEQRTDDRK